MDSISPKKRSATMRAVGQLLGGYKALDANKQSLALYDAVFEKT
jgi:hypothetical protein